MKSSDLLILAGSAALAYLLLKWARQDAMSPMGGYLRYANSAPAGFVYDPVLDAWARTREDGVKEIYV